MNVVDPFIYKKFATCGWYIILCEIIGYIGINNWKTYDFSAIYWLGFEYKEDQVFAMQSSEKTIGILIV